MINEGLPDELAQFIFESVDSVEMLDVLLLLKSKPDIYLSAQSISSELRTNPESVGKRLRDLKGLNLIAEHATDFALFCYNPATPRLAALMDVLADSYKVRRQRVLAAIFSPTKKVRNFADAFLMRTQKKEDSDG